MSRHPVQLTQADVARIMRAADQAWPDKGFRVRIVANEIVVERMTEAAYPSPDLAQKSVDQKKDWHL